MFYGAATGATYSGKPVIEVPQDLERVFRKEFPEAELGRTSSFDPSLFIVSSRYEWERGRQWLLERVMADVANREERAATIAGLFDLIENLRDECRPMEGLSDEEQAEVAAIFPDADEIEKRTRSLLEKWSKEK